MPPTSWAHHRGRQSPSSDQHQHTQDQWHETTQVSASTCGNLIQASARRPAALFLLAFAISKYGLARGISNNLLQRGTVLRHVPQYHPSHQIKRSAEAGPDLILGPWVQIPFPQQPVIKGKTESACVQGAHPSPTVWASSWAYSKDMWWWWYLWNEHSLFPTLTVQFYYFDHQAGKHK